jgi:hypothetical protein
VKRQSQVDRILDVLKDGRWHTAAEIHQRAGFSRLNSRMSDIRFRRGIAYEHRTTGVGSAGSEYRLVRALATEEENGCGTVASSAASVPPTPSHRLREEELTSDADDMGGALPLPGQLTLEAA